MSPDDQVSKQAAKQAAREAKQAEREAKAAARQAKLDERLARINEKEAERKAKYEQWKIEHQAKDAQRKADYAEKRAADKAMYEAQRDADRAKREDEREKSRIQNAEAKEQMAQAKDDMKAAWADMKAIRSDPVVKHPRAKFDKLSLSDGELRHGMLKRWPAAECTAVVESGAALQQRMTATRVVAGVVLAGPIGAIIGGMAKKTTGGEMFLVVEVPGDAVVLEVTRKQIGAAHKFAAALNASK